MKWLKQSVEGLIELDFVRFCIVGALGFAINSTLLFLIYRRIGLNIYGSQLISSEISLFSNFLLHNSWTYKNQKVHKSILKLLVEFHLTSWVAILGSAALVGFLVNFTHLNYFFALVVASAVALVWNYVWSKYFVWHEKDEVNSERSNI